MGGRALVVVLLLINKTTTLNPQTSKVTHHCSPYTHTPNPTQSRHPPRCLSTRSSPPSVNFSPSKP